MLVSNSTALIIPGAIHLFLMIASVCIVAFLKLRYSMRFSVLNTLIMAVQLFNLALLPKYIIIISRELLFLPVNRDFWLLTAAEYVFAFLLMLRFAWLLRKARIRRRNPLIPQAIREAVDYLPGGLCFSAPNGMPILTNYRMNELVCQLTGHTVMNAQLTWEELQILDCSNGNKKLESLWINRVESGDIVDECLYFSLTDGTIWRFRKEHLTERSPHYIQLEATEITDLYRYSIELFETNNRLAKQYKRQQNLLENIAEVNHSKEILAAKMRIHDDLGQSILMTKQYLTNHALSGNPDYLIDSWNNTIRNLADITRIHKKQPPSPEIELRKVAEMIGCTINFSGVLPSGRSTGLLFYAAVREALANAVKHANADQLNVVISQTNQGYHVEISDNAASPVSKLVEGGGLGNLRKRLEQEGATLQIICKDGVVLIIELPTGKIDMTVLEV